MTFSLFLFFLGRFLLGAAFVVFGLRNYPRIGALTEVMVKRGVLPQPRTFMMIGVGIQVIGGLMVATGVLAWLGALALAVFLIAAAYLLHNFWDYPEAERTPHVIAWIMNTGLAGAFLMVMGLSL